MTDSSSTANFAPGIKLPHEIVTDTNKASVFRVPTSEVMKLWSSQPLRSDEQRPWPRLDIPGAQTADGDGK